MKHIIKRHRPLLLGSVLCVLASSLFATILQFFKGSVLDSAAAGNGAEALRSLLLLIGSILLRQRPRSRSISLVYLARYSPSFRVRKDM